MKLAESVSSAARQNFGWKSTHLQSSRFTQELQELKGEKDKEQSVLKGRTQPLIETCAVDHCTTHYGNFQLEEPASARAGRAPQMCPGEKQCHTDSCTRDNGPRATASTPLHCSLQSSARSHRVQRTLPGETTARLRSLMKGNRAPEKLQFSEQMKEVNSVISAAGGLISFCRSRIRSRRSEMKEHGSSARTSNSTDSVNQANRRGRGSRTRC
ncbi:unnamed protein product [Pleuronectes platessa]|uniref:Uncharacterized protein n=1 Tax=Pleuronectes platessa TaxID=8262 RepID=A0A9N7U5Y9_PLEPL|nr:unnamed protein product [Pleuronectes platessa]